MEQAGPRRRPPGGGYARGDEKRVKIIEAALGVFGEHGYERASTRQIAQDAGVNPPALQYYFESKEGLHLACAEYIAERVTQALEPAYAAADEIGPNDPEGAAADALCGIMDAFAEFLFGTAQMDGWSRFLARGQGEDRGPAYSALKQKVSGRLHASCARLVGLATSCSPADPQTKLRTIAILGQLSVFHLGRSNALAMLGWPDFRGERLEMLKGLLRAQTRAILHPISALDAP
jgi:AcrR family transcriptional regulator